MSVPVNCNFAPSSPQSTSLICTSFTWSTSPSHVYQTFAKKSSKDIFLSSISFTWPASLLRGATCPAPEPSSRQTNMPAINASLPFVLFQLTFFTPILSFPVAMIALNCGWLSSTGRGLKRGLCRSFPAASARPNSGQLTCQET